MKFDGSRFDLVEEFKARPFGPHSEELKRLLDEMRRAPVANRYVLVTVRRDKEWVLGRLSRRPDRPIDIRWARRYRSLEQAEWDVFKLRWRELSGVDLTGLVEEPSYGLKGC